MSKNAKSQIHVGKTKKRKKFEWWVEWGVRVLGC